MATTAAVAPSRAEHGAAAHGVALMVAGGLLLGTIGVFVEEAGQHPLTTVWFRCVFGGAALLLWGAATRRLGELALRGKALAVALAAGVLMITNWALFFAAIERTSIGVATVVFHVQPLWVLALGAWWLRERVTRRQLGATLLALIGLTLATGLLDGSATDIAMSSRYAIGLLMCLGGSLSYAAVTLIAQRAKDDGASSFALAWWQCTVGSVALGWWPVSHGWPAWGSGWAWLVGLGVIHTGLAYVVLYAGMARLSTGRIALLQFVYPAAAVLIDWAVYGRALSVLQISGVVLMALALSAVTRAVGRAPSAPQTAAARSPAARP
ncbi:MAG: DMT family transporter [Burkholderiaceae bacterium]|nr:DMT family transporter [Burkholderiaceae bacterium]